MGDEIATSSQQVLSATKGAGSRRQMAGALKRQLSRRSYAATQGKKVAKREYLAKMITELALNQETFAMDGTSIQCGDYNDWLKTVQFVFNHLDGPATQEAQFNGVNIFKVYAGIDPDKV